MQPISAPLHRPETKKTPGANPLPLEKFVDTRYYYIVMKKITITLDERVAHWAGKRAAEQDTSLSRLVGNLLREKMLDEKDYLIAMQQYLSQPPWKLKKSGAKYPSRQELHAR